MPTLTFSSSREFKILDFGTSNQGYWLKVSALEGSNTSSYHFLFIPVSQYSSLLMLDFLLAKKDIGNSLNYDLITTLKNDLEGVREPLLIPSSREGSSKSIMEELGTGHRIDNNNNLTVIRNVALSKNILKNLSRVEPNHIAFRVNGDRMYIDFIPNSTERNRTHKLNISGNLYKSFRCNRHTGAVSWGAVLSSKEFVKPTLIERMTFSERSFKKSSSVPYQTILSIRNYTTVGIIDYSLTSSLRDFSKKSTVITESIVSGELIVRLKEMLIDRSLSVSDRDLTTVSDVVKAMIWSDREQDNTAMIESAIPFTKKHYRDTITHHEHPLARLRGRQYPGLNHQNLITTMRDTEHPIVLDILTGFTRDILKGDMYINNDLVITERGTGVYFPSPHDPRNNPMYIDYSYLRALRDIVRSYMFIEWGEENAYRDVRTNLIISQDGSLKGLRDYSSQGYIHILPTYQSSRAIGRAGKVNYLFSGIRDRSREALMSYSPSGDRAILKALQLLETNRFTKNISKNALLFYDLSDTEGSGTRKEQLLSLGKLTNFSRDTSKNIVLDLVFSSERQKENGLYIVNSSEARRDVWYFGFISPIFHAIRNNRRSAWVREHLDSLIRGSDPPSFRSFLGLLMDEILIGSLGERGSVFQDIIPIGEVLRELGGTIYEDLSGKVRRNTESLVSEDFILGTPDIETAHISEEYLVGARERIEALLESGILARDISGEGSILTFSVEAIRGILNGFVQEEEICGVAETEQGYIDESIGGKNDRSFEGGIDDNSSVGYIEASPADFADSITAVLNRRRKSLTQELPKEGQIEHRDGVSENQLEADLRKSKAVLASRIALGSEERGTVIKVDSYLGQESRIADDLLSVEGKVDSHKSVFSSTISANSGEGRESVLDKPVISDTSKERESHFLEDTRVEGEILGREFDIFTYLASGFVLAENTKLRAKFLDQLLGYVPERLAETLKDKLADKKVLGYLEDIANSRKESEGDIENGLLLDIQNVREGLEDAYIGAGLQSEGVEFLDSYEFLKESEGYIDFDLLGEQEKKAFLDRLDTLAQGFLYDYSTDIIGEGSDPEFWEGGFGVPEDYDPHDPFNPYYPWSYEYTTKHLAQLGDWVRFGGGNWTRSVDQGEFYSHRDDNVIGGYYRNDFSSTDYRFSVDFIVEDGEDKGAGLVFKFKDPQNYFMFMVHGGDDDRSLNMHNEMQLYKVVNGVTTPLGTPMNPFSWFRGKWHNILVTVMGDRIQIQVDGRLQYDVVEP